MKRINSAAEFKEFYPYKSPPNPEPMPPLNEYPKRYPCFAKVIHHNGGIGGSYETVKIIYPPKGVDLKSFELGLNAIKD